MGRMGTLAAALSLPLLLGGCPAMMAVMLPGMGGGHSPGGSQGDSQTPAPEKKGEQPGGTEPPRENRPVPQ